MSRAIDFDGTDMLRPPTGRIGFARPASRCARAGRRLLPLSWRQNLSWTLLGNLVYTGCRWGLLVAITQLGSPEMVGRFALALGICTPVFTLCNINLRSVQAVDTQRGFDFSHYLSLRLITVIMALAITATIAVLSGYDETTILLIVLLSLGKSSESLSDLFYGLFQRVERMDYSAISMVLTGVLSVLALGLVLHLTHRLDLAIVALAAASLAIFFAFDLPRGVSILASEAGDDVRSRDVVLPLMGSICGKVAARTTYRLAVLALPLGIGSFLCSLSANIPLYVIAVWIGGRQLGYFAALASSTIALNMIARSLSTTIAPTLAKCLDSGSERQFLRHVVRTVILASALGGAAVAVAWLLGKPLLSWVYGVDYAAHEKLFFGLVVVAALSAISTTLSLATTAARLFREQALVYGFNAIFVLAVCWLLVPHFGLWGAVIASGAAAVLRILIYGILIHAVVRRKAPLVLWKLRAVS